MRTRRRWLAWSGLACTLLFALLWALNVPFYAGSRIGSIGAWRLEHGRFTLSRVPFPSTEAFYIAPNSEGPRFLPDWRFFARSDGSASVPLWIPLAIVAAIMGREWRRPRRTLRGKCPACGYSLRGLAAGAPCPECGAPATLR